MRACLNHSCNIALGHSPRLQGESARTPRVSKTLLGLCLAVAFCLAGTNRVHAQEPGGGQTPPVIESFSVMYMELQPGEWEYVFSGHVSSSGNVAGLTVEINGGPFNETAITDDFGDFWVQIIYGDVDPVSGVDVYSMVTENGQAVSNVAVVQL